jgi:hypothetical protein
MKVFLPPLLSIGISSFVVAAQQHVRLTTTSANFDLSITYEQGRTVPSINDLFRFESATSKLFHEGLSADANTDADHVVPNAIVVSVHVEHMTHDEYTSTTTNVDDGVGLTLKSVVSVTFSDIGLNNALEVASVDGGGLDVNADTDVASLLSKSVSHDDILRVMIAEGLVANDTRVLVLSFTEFDGSSNSRGVTATESNIIYRKKDDGLLMFLAGVMMTLLLLSIATVSAWVYKREVSSWDDHDSCKSVHFKDNANVEDATTASGMLGGKGHHPRAENDENTNPNSSAYRRKSPMSRKSGAASVSSRHHPLGITRMESVLTPQKSKNLNDQAPMYDIERLM